MGQTKSVTYVGTVEDFIKWGEKQLKKKRHKHKYHKRYRKKSLIEKVAGQQ